MRKSLKMAIFGALCGGLFTVAAPASAAVGVVGPLDQNPSATLMERVGHGSHCRPVYVRRCLESRRRYGRRICVRWVNVRRVVCH
jgi:hypothetical protein